MSDVCIDQKLKWEGPYRFGKWIQDIVNYDFPTDPNTNFWPESRQGVYVITGVDWKDLPWNVPDGQLLYVGSGRNILQRIGQLVQDLLGFCGESQDGGRYAGSHSGGEKLWCFCNQYGTKYGALSNSHTPMSKLRVKTKDLYIAWAVTSEPCHTCTEAALLEQHKGELNDRDKPDTRCCCSPLQHPGE